MPVRSDQNRAGRYVRQQEGHRAFLPAPLPPEPPLRMEGELQKALSQADREIGRLDGSVRTLPNPDLFVRMYVRKEAVLSSQIEGTQSSLQDLLAAEAKTAAPGPAGDVGEVANCVAAMNLGMELLAQLPLSVRLLREIHARLMRGVRGGESPLTPGELRTSQNRIGGSGLADAVFVPPPAHSVPGAMGDLEKFMHRENGIPPLAKIGLVHAQFETIHPFLDGNGRLGRLLITFWLAERGVLQKPVLYLSHYFKRRRAEYYERLQAVRDEGEWEEWLLFFLRGVAEVAADAGETARKILLLREEHRAAIIGNFGRAAGGGLTLLEGLYDRPIVTVRDAQQLTGLTYAAANNLTERITGLGILRNQNPGARPRSFRYDSYVRLFEDGGDE